MNTLSLEQILNNKKSNSSSFVVINDTVQQSALPLLLEIGQRALKDDKELIVVLTETSPKAWQEQFPVDKLSDIYIIDCYTNPQGWNTALAAQDNILQINDIQDMENLILSPIMKRAMETSNCNILIDSITPFAMDSQYKTYQLIKALESLTTDAIRLIVGFHSDIKIMSETGLNLQDALNRLASVNIKLESTKERTHFETTAALTGFIPQETFSYLKITSNCITKGGIAHIEWRKKSGKVTYESNGFIFSGNSVIAVPINQLIQEENEEKDDKMELDTKVDPTANLSFNLSLTDEQRKQKENLILPHYKAQQLEVSSDEPAQNTSSGLIYYDPDAADDFDDEDPDDDLDI